MKFNADTEIPLEDFFEAYYLCRRRKRRTVNAMEFELDYEHNLVQLWKDVNSGNYEIGRSICFVITRPKIREIFAADFRDRIVHHVVMMRLEPLFEAIFVNDNYNCRKGKGTLYGVKRLYEQIRECSDNYTKQCYIGKFDMKSFFMSIHKPTLWQMLHDFILANYNSSDKPILLKLVEQIVMNCPHYNCFRKSNKSMWKKLDASKSMFTCGDDFGLPIGNLTSQCFANFYLHSFDTIMKNVFTYYGRYVDDYYVLSDEVEKIVFWIPFMRKYLRHHLKVTLHKDKVYIQPYWNGVKFVGSVVKGNRIYVSNSTVSNIHIKIHAYNRNILQENAERFMQTLNSYWGFLHYNRSYNIKKILFDMISPAWFKYIGYNAPKHKFAIKPSYNEVAIIKSQSKSRKLFCEEYYSF